MIKFSGKPWYLSPIVHLVTSVLVIAVLVVCGENNKNAQNLLVSPSFITEQSVGKSASDGLGKAEDGLNKVLGGVTDLFKQITPTASNVTANTGTWTAFPALATAVTANSALGSRNQIYASAKLAIASDGNPLIAYTDFPIVSGQEKIGPLKVAKYNGTSWEELVSPGKIDSGSGYSLVYSNSIKAPLIAHADNNLGPEYNIYIKSWYGPKSIWSNEKVYKATSSLWGFSGVNLLATVYGDLIIAKEAMQGVDVSFWGLETVDFNFTREWGKPFGNASENHKIKKPQMAPFIGNNEQTCFIGAVVVDRNNANYGNLQVKLQSDLKWTDYGQPLSGQKQTLAFSLTSVRNEQITKDIPLVAVNYVEGNLGDADAIYGHAAVVWNSSEHKWSEPIVLCRSIDITDCIGAPSIVYSKKHNLVLVSYVAKEKSSNSYKVYTKAITSSGVVPVGKESSFATSKNANYHQLVVDTQGTIYLVHEAGGTLNVLKWTR